MHTYAYIRIQITFLHKYVPEAGVVSGGSLAGRGRALAVPAGGVSHGLEVSVDCLLAAEGAAGGSPLACGSGATLAGQ
eukprot:scaffold158474_cov50-Prasinocladus_malaysianus.AAC.1